MIREEAIIILKCAMPNSSMGCGESDEEIEEALTMAIEALKREENPNSIRINFVGKKEAKEFNEYLNNQQEPKESVFNKIKAEIEVKCCITVGRENYGAITLHDVFEIIDKYKAESEV